MAWTEISDAVIEIGKAVRALDIRAIRDNIVAIAEGQAGAPRIQTAAINNNAVTTAKILNSAVTQPKIATNSVGTGEIKFGTRSFSRSFSSSNNTSVYTFSDNYAWMPRFTSTNSSLAFAGWQGIYDGTANRIRVEASRTGAIGAPNATYTISWRYVTS